MERRSGHPPSGSTGSWRPLPERYEEALREASQYAQRMGTPAELELLQRVQAFRGRFADSCARLESVPVPASLDHNDLHPWNIFVTASESGRLSARFYDWGDAVIAHPFASLLVPLRQLRQQRQLADDDPQIVRLRDAYLEPFGDLASSLARRAGRDRRARLPRRQGGTRAHLGPGLDESHLGSGA